MAVSGRKYYASQRKADKKAENMLFDRQIESTNKDYDTQVFEQGRAYEDQYRDNAVQKEINKRQVAESMANLGLRDSGLNRTQQTAVQLSYGNNRASIDKQRQAGIDSLNFSRRQTIDAIKQNRIAAIANIDKTYDNLALQYDENKKAEAKQMVLSYLEMGATPSKKLLKTSGMSDSEYAAYKKYYDKLLSKAASKVARSGGGVKTDSFKLTNSETKEIKNIFKENGQGEGAYQKVLSYLSLLGKTPTDDIEETIKDVLGYKGETQYEQNKRNNGGSFYSEILSVLKEEKDKKTSNSEVQIRLKGYMEKGYLSQSEYMTLYNKYRDNKLG